MKDEIKKLIKGRIDSFDCVGDVLFTVFLRECFLSIKGDLNGDLKTKEELYQKLKCLDEIVRDAWKGVRI